MSQPSPGRSGSFLTAPAPHRRSLEGAFPGAALEWKATATPTATGFLEVSVNGTLVHSKKAGDGYVDSQAKTDKMCVPASRRACHFQAGALCEVVERCFDSVVVRTHTSFASASRPCPQLGGGEGRTGHVSYGSRLSGMRARDGWGGATRWSTRH